MTIKSFLENLEPPLPPLWGVPPDTYSHEAHPELLAGDEGV